MTKPTLLPTSAHAKAHRAAIMHRPIDPSTGRFLKGGIARRGEVLAERGKDR